MTALAELPATQKPYQPYGAARELMYARDHEVILSGPAGTGKSRACLEKVHLCALKYAGMRGLIVRKTRESLTESALVTFETNVAIDGSPPTSNMQRRMRQAYHYPNGSEIVVGGLDKPTKIMSTEYDMIYVQEAIELSENDLESATTRLRNGVMPYQQLIGDTNPDTPIHWLKQRADAKRLRMLESRHEDNPRLFDQATGELTDEGRVYIGRLDNLTGVRYHRLRKGLWVAAEGVIFEDFDPAIHLIARNDARYGLANGIPRDWPRYWTIDFGYTNPFVFQAWAQDPDGRLFRYKEIYRTGVIVEDHAEHIMEIMDGDRVPVAVICDHDAGDRATFERHTGLETTPAQKSVISGLQRVVGRLRKKSDGMPRLLFLRDSLDEVDKSLEEDKKPTSTEEEIPGYVWDTRMSMKKGDQPLKLNDHGCDATRYMVTYVDPVDDDDDEFSGSAPLLILGVSGMNG